MPVRVGKGHHDAWTLWRTALALPLVLLLLAAAAASGAEILVLSDGREILVQDFDRADLGADFHLYRLPGGDLMGLTAEEVDVPATILANESDHEPHTLRASPTPQRSRALEPGAWKVITPEPERGPQNEVDLSFREAPVVDVVRLLADMEDLNLVVHPTVTGTVTVELHQVPWEQAMQMVLRTAGLASELDGNVLYIAPVKVMVQEARELEALRQARRLR